MMKALVIHDRQGNINAVVTIPSDAPPIASAGVPGQLVTEVELPDMPFDATKPENQERVFEVLQAYRVEFARQGKLVKPKS